MPEKPKKASAIQDVKFSTPIPNKTEEASQPPTKTFAGYVGGELSEKTKEISHSTSLSEQEKEKRSEAILCQKLLIPYFNAILRIESDIMSGVCSKREKLLILKGKYTEAKKIIDRIKLPELKPFLSENCNIFIRMINTFFPQIPLEHYRNVLRKTDLVTLSFYSRIGKIMHGLGYTNDPISSKEIEAFIRNRRLLRAKKEDIAELRELVAELKVCSDCLKESRFDEFRTVKNYNNMEIYVDPALILQDIDIITNLSENSILTNIDAKETDRLVGPPWEDINTTFTRELARISKRCISENRYGSLGNTQVFFSQNTLNNLFSQNTLNNFEKYVEEANLTISSFYVKMKKLEDKLGYQLESKLSSKENSLFDRTEIEALTKNKKLNMSEEDIIELEKLADKANVLLGHIKEDQFEKCFIYYKSKWELPTLVKNLEAIAGAPKTNPTLTNHVKEHPRKK